ncbi:MAG: ABC transporter permease [Chloroflexi bacterium]|nr:ABC transporter permease [Chloroflexota bacterium]
MAVGEVRDVQGETAGPLTASAPGVGGRRGSGASARFWSRILPRILPRILRQPATAVGAIIMLVLIVTAVGADVIAPHDPFSTSTEAFRPPSAVHLFGTDDLGRDVFSGVVHGARVSLLVGLVSALTATLIGVLVGGLAGYAGSLVDDVLMRLTEVFMVVPRFFLVLVVVSLFGGSIWLIVLVLGLTMWPSTARLLRSQVLSLRTRDYVVAARAIGVSEPGILIRHVLPAALPPVITQAALQVGGAILTEAGLSFLGLGDRNVMSWGIILNDAQQFVRQAWWISAFPGLAITLTVLAMNLVADGLNEAFDPRLSGR